MKKLFAVLALIFLNIGFAFGSNTAVTLYGQVNTASAYEIITAIQEANRDLRNTDPIILYIYSPGGDLISGSTIVNAMLASRRPVWTVDIGYAASMAAIIHSYGVKKFLMPRAVLMHHNVSSSAEGDLPHMQSQIAAIARLAEMYEKHIAQLAHISLAELRVKEAENWYLVDDEAVKAHLADGVVNPDQYPAPQPPRP